MEINYAFKTHDDYFRAEGFASRGRLLAQRFAIAVLLAFGAPAIVTSDEKDQPAAPWLEASADANLAGSEQTRPPNKRLCRSTLPSPTGSRTSSVAPQLVCVSMMVNPSLVISSS